MRKHFGYRMDPFFDLDRDVEDILVERRAWQASKAIILCLVLGACALLGAWIGSHF